MSNNKKNPVDQKNKLLEQLKEIEQKISDFDKQRAKKVASLAKQFKLTDLSDKILKEEFSLIRDKYKSDNNLKLETEDPVKKNSLAEDKVLELES